MDSGSKVQFSDREALLYHSYGRPGKIEIIASKPMATQRDLSLAYSPGVAVPVKAIADDPATAYDYTAKGNLVAVISNGKIGRAHVWTPVTNAHLVCRLLLEKKNKTRNSYQ